MTKPTWTFAPIALAVLAFALAMCNGARLAFAQDDVDQPGLDRDGEDADGDDETNAALRHTIDELTAELTDYRAADAAAAAEAAEEEEAPPQYWSGFVNVAFTYDTGTTEILSLAAAFEVAYDDLGTWEFAIGAYDDLSITNGIANKHDLFGYVSLDYIPYEVVSPFVFASKGLAESRLIDLAAQIGIGAKWTFMRDPWPVDEYDETPWAKYSLSVAVLYDHESFEPAAATPDSDLFRMSIRFKAKQRLTDGVVLKDTAFFVPAFENFEDFTITNVISLTVDVGDDFGIGVGHDFSYDSTPPTGVKNAEHRVWFELSWSWKA